jgi:cystathionine gamma-lyase
MENLYRGFSTIAIHQGQDPENWNSRCVVPPIVLATTFKQLEAGKYFYEYSRCDNPTRRTLEECLAALEEAKDAHCYSSGVACITAISFLLKTGQHVLMCDDVYSGTYNYFSICASRMGIESSYVNMIDIDNVKKELRTNTAMVWIESPTNPTLKLVDIRAVCDAVRETHPNAIIVVDNTFSSTYYQAIIYFCLKSHF